jgi:hypothetical protein
VLALESQIKESTERYARPHPSRIQIAFAVYGTASPSHLTPPDELMDVLGPQFRPLMESIKSEFDTHVYSHEYTTSSTGAIERQPFFSISARLVSHMYILISLIDFRMNEEEKMGRIVDDQSQQLKFSQHDVTILAKRNLSLKYPIPFMAEFQATDCGDGTECGRFGGKIECNRSAIGFKRP